MFMYCTSRSGCFPSPNIWRIKCLCLFITVAFTGYFNNPKEKLGNWRPYEWESWTYVYQMQSSTFLFCSKNAWTVFNLDSNVLVHTSAVHSSAVNKVEYVTLFLLESGKTHWNASKTHSKTHLEFRNCGDLAIRLVENLYSDRFSCQPATSFTLIYKRFRNGIKFKTENCRIWQFLEELNLEKDFGWCFDSPSTSLAHSVTAMRAL